jgi:predicted transcriptional regulator
MASKKDQAIGILLTSKTIQQAADTLGVDERTVRKWLEDPAFLAEYKAAKRKCLDQTIMSIQAMNLKALDSLEKILDGNDPKLYTAAAKAVLDLNFKVIQIEELQTQIDELRKYYEESAKTNR